ncbi:hypothetical protein F8M41_026104 [Gigaspora margarita]|uniref:Uncharacterized protein n=1 Tax=Gigaspora margarita TaxID=4874 RepID=A0A8H4ET15_GIGMA|nr:hypothetical protein F8M41_026104 [Gigaspora margarita]
MSTLGNDSGYEPLCNTNRSISKEKSPVSEASSNTTSRDSNITSRDSSISRDSNITSRDSNITLKGSSISRDSSTSRETASSIEISTNTALQLLKSNNTLAKFRELWWTQGNIHPSAKWEEASLPYLLISDVDWEKYTERTDFFNVHGSWEWINGNVYVYELPLGPHETCSRAIDRVICSKDPEMTLINLGSTRTKADNMGKEADGSFIPKHKPNVNSNGRDGSDSICRVLNITIVIINQVSNTGDYTLLA